MSIPAFSANIFHFIFRLCSIVSRETFFRKNDSKNKIIATEWKRACCKQEICNRPFVITLYDCLYYLMIVIRPWPCQFAYSSPIFAFMWFCTYSMIMSASVRVPSSISFAPLNITMPLPPSFST